MPYLDQWTLYPRPQLTKSELIQMPGEVAALSGQWPSYLSLDYLSRATQKLDLGGGKRKKRKREEGGRTEREERESFLTRCCQQVHRVTVESERHPAAAYTCLQVQASLGGTVGMAASKLKARQKQSSRPLGALPLHSGSLCASDQTSDHLDT